MDDRNNSHGSGRDQHRARAIREAEDDLDRATDDLTFIVGKVINDVASDDLSAYVRFEAEEAAKDAIREQNRPAKKALRAPLRVLS